MFAKFEKHPLRTVRENTEPYNAKTCLSLKYRDSVKINSSSIKNAHAHLIMSTTSALGLKRDQLKLP